jgi:hypothetical protein
MAHVRDRKEKPSAVVGPVSAGKIADKYSYIKDDHGRISIQCGDLILDGWLLAQMQPDDLSQFIDFDKLSSIRFDGP